MIRLDIYSNYKIDFMLAWLYIFVPIPIISIILLIFSNWYLISFLMLLVYFFIAIISFCFGCKMSNKLKYRFIILEDEYFEIEDKYGNYTRFDNTILYPSKGGPLYVFIYVITFAQFYNGTFIDDDFTIDCGIEKINCYISYKTYKVLKHLNYKYLYNE